MVDGEKTYAEKPSFITMFLIIFNEWEVASMCEC